MSEQFNRNDNPIWSAKLHTKLDETMKWHVSDSLRVRTRQPGQKEFVSLEDYQEAFISETEKVVTTQLKIWLTKNEHEQKIIVWRALATISFLSRNNELSNYARPATRRTISLIKEMYPDISQSNLKSREELFEYDKANKTFSLWDFIASISIISAQLEYKFFEKFCKWNWMNYDNEHTKSMKYAKNYYRYKKQFV